MTLQPLRDLEQRWREKAASRRNMTNRSDGKAAAGIECADELAAVRRTLEARLEDLPLHDSDREIPNEHSYWIDEADLAACLVGTQEQKNV